MKNRRHKITDVKYLSYLIRHDILDVAVQTHMGHIAPALTIADIIAVLYTCVLSLRKTKRFNPNRDRFILSKGHAALALFSALYRKGFLSKKTLFSYGKNGSYLGVHPEYNPQRGIEWSTGSLGHGLNVACGMAWSFQKDTRPNRVIVLLSDAEVNEGSTWEAALFAAHHKLDNLTAIIDYNGQQAMGKTKDILNLDPLDKKWASFGWGVKTCDGNSTEELTRALKHIPFIKGKPSLLVAKTVGGKGASFMEGDFRWHYWPITAELYQKALADLQKLYHL